MTDELITCAAALFRIKGKDVLTEKEFTLTASIDLKWVSNKSASILMNRMVDGGILVKKNGLLKPGMDFSTVPVPIAYTPSQELKNSLSAPAETPEKPRTVEKREDPADMFPELMDIAMEHGIEKRTFVPECNSVKKKLGVNMCTAALLVLRDAGVDIGGLTARVYTQTVENR
ncbi:MAG: DUF2240 family protein [archaeon]|nr:DUF2240 family protein [archaeon]